MIQDRLKKIIQGSGLSLVRFAQKTGVSKNTLINYRDGATSPGASFLESVCRQFSADPAWLLLGEMSALSQVAYESAAGECEEYALVPLLESRVTAGPEGEILYGEIADHYPFKKWWIHKLVGESAERLKGLFLIRVRGDSMSPTISQGEMALVDTWEAERIEVLAGRIYLVILPDGSTALKRLVLSGDDSGLKMVCLSDNTADYRPFEFALDPEKSLKSYVLGRVRWAGKEFD
ncbi:MAG TPA: S24 family peptidase [Syntrophobacteraceae bacterium]|nr:S24 family peptidase [Syntrophobacteraceae bacterium]